MLILVVKACVFNKLCEIVEVKAQTWMLVWLRRPRSVEVAGVLVELDVGNILEEMLILACLIPWREQLRCTSSFLKQAGNPARPIFFTAFY